MLLHTEHIAGATQPWKPTRDTPLHVTYGSHQRSVKTPNTGKRPSSQERPSVDKTPDNPQITHYRGTQVTDGGEHGAIAHIPDY